MEAMVPRRRLRGKQAVVEAHAHVVDAFAPMPEIQQPRQPIAQEQVVADNGEVVQSKNRTRAMRAAEFVARRDKRQQDKLDSEQLRGVLAQTRLQLIDSQAALTLAQQHLAVAKDAAAHAIQAAERLAEQKGRLTQEKEQLKNENAKFNRVAELAMDQQEKEHHRILELVVQQFPAAAAIAEQALKEPRCL